MSLFWGKLNCKLITHAASNFMPKLTSVYVCVNGVQKLYVFGYIDGCRGVES